MFKDPKRFAIADIRSWDEEKIQIGYCDLQNLFAYTDRNGYNAGVYGWNFDFYFLGTNKVLMTGYRGMFGRKPKVNVHEYDEKARVIVNDWHIPYEEKKSKLDALIEDLAEKI